MNTERIQLKGQLVEAKSKFKNLDMEASGLIVLLRTYLNPFEEDLTKIETEKILSSANRLNKIIAELKTAKKKVEDLEAYFE